MEESVRPATAGDLEVVAALAEAMVAELRDARGGELWAAKEARPVPAAPSLAADIEDPSVLVLLGEYEGHPAGLAVVRCEALPDGRSLGVITDLYVEPELRQVGIGEALLAEVLRWAEERGCVGVDAMALPGLREAKNFYESAGLVARAITVHKSFGGGGGKAARR